MHMWVGFCMHCDAIGAGVDESRNEFIGPGYHQMDVERCSRAVTERAHGVGAKADIWHENAIHDIEMQPLGSRLLNCTSLFAKTTEIRGEDRGRDNDRRHRRSHFCSR